MSLKSFAIIATGDELVNGMRLDTNSRFFAQELYKNFVDVDMHLSCKDDRQRLTNMINFLLPCHHMIITGGLGPTDDDLTRNVVAGLVGKPLQYQSEVASAVKEYLRCKGLNMYDRHYKQCYFPEGSILVENLNGTAWGFIVEYERSSLYVLPGPPKENQLMFDFCLEHILQNNYIKHEHRLKWFVSGPEERVVNVIEDVVVRAGIDLHTCSHQDADCEVYFSLPHDSWPLNLINDIIYEIESAWRLRTMSFKSCHRIVGE